MLAPHLEFQPSPGRPPRRHDLGALSVTLAVALALAATWGPAHAAPVIELSPTRLGFEPVTLGDTVTARFDIANRGDATLTVTGMDLPPGTEVSVAMPFDLEPDATVQVNVAYAPPDTLPGDQTITIRSNDPVTPDAEISFDPDVLALAVEANAFTVGPEYPLGEALVIQCVPHPGVHVERVTLFYRSGVFTSYVPIDMVPNGPVFIGIIPGGSVQEGGVEFYVLAENAPFSVTDPAEGADRPFRVDVAQPNDFKLDPVVRNPGQGFKAGDNIDFLLTLQRGTVFERGTLHYRVGGDSLYQTTEILEISFTGINASISGLLVGPRGIEYWAEVITATTTLTQPFDPSVPFPLRVNVERLVEPEPHDGLHYRMVSVPLEFPNANLGTILSDETPFGSYDPVRWRAFRFVSETVGNVELTPAQADTFRLRPGRAFWLVSRDAHRIDTAPAPGLSTPSQLFNIELQPGWNQIGNPFAFPVAVSRLRRSFAFGELIAYDSDSDDYSDEDVTELEPFTGYFIDNPSTEVELLGIPPVAVDSAQTPPPPGPGLLAGLRLEARSPHGRDRANRIGLAAGASAELDALDRPEPPPAPGSAVRLSLANRDWRNRPGLYRRDVRSSLEGGATWEIEVTSDVPGDLVELTLTREGAWPEGTVMRLFDREQGSVVELDSRASEWRHEVLAGARPYRLALVAGSPHDVERLGVQERPDRLVLDAVTPNPSRGPQRIRFGLPRASAVRLEVFDATGRRVATLLDGAELPAGYHTALWRPGRGGVAASGVYFHRLTVAGEARTTRSVVVR